jgi:hypothetical protein
MCLLGVVFFLETNLCELQIVARSPIPLLLVVLWRIREAFYIQKGSNNARTWLFRRRFLHRFLASFRTDSFARGINESNSFQKYQFLNNVYFKL